jgi:hypothetical protein
MGNSRKKKRTRKSGEHLKKYVKAFGAGYRQNKMIDNMAKKLYGHEKLSTPSLDKALKKLRGSEKRNTPMLDEAYKRLAGRSRRLRA